MKSGRQTSTRQIPVCAPKFPGGGKRDTIIDFTVSIIREVSTSFYRRITPILPKK